MFFRNKNFKNKDGTSRNYLHLVENKKVNSKVVQTSLVNFGRIDDGSAAEKIDRMIDLLISQSKNYSLLNIEKDIDSKSSLQCGPISVFKKLWVNSKLQKFVSESFEERNIIFNSTEAIFNLTLNRLIDPSSKRRMTQFQEEIYDIAKFDLHQYYRAMDYLVEEKETIERKIIDDFIVTKKKKIDLMFFDTTTIVYYGDDPQEESELLDYGFSKAHRGDLKQIVIGILMSKEGIPLAHEVFPGNQNDVSNFKEIINKIKKKFEIDQVILVGDRGMISSKNISLLSQSGYQYILGYRMRTLPIEERAVILKKANLKKVNDTLEWKEILYNGQRLLVCYNPERAVKDAEHREKIIERLSEKIKEGSIKSIIDNKDYKRYLDIEGKAPKISKEKIKYDELYDGVYIITTNTKLSGGQVIDSYKGLWQVEQGFRRLKSEIEIGPLYHYTDNRIRAHVMICFFALILRTILTKQLQEFFPKESYQECLRDLKNLHVVIMQIKKRSVHLRTEVLAGAQKIFEALKMRPPDKILYDEYSQGRSKVVLQF